MNDQRAGRRSAGDPGGAGATPSEPLFQRPLDEGIPESDRVVAVVATEVDPRMMVQRSCFTIHGGTASPVGELPNDQRFLLRFEIPPGAKAEIRVGLSRIGVKLSNLFPDLEHLAEETEALRGPWTGRGTDREAPTRDDS